MKHIENIDKEVSKKLEDKFDKFVIRSSSNKCSYKCRYYLDGPVLSYCNKYGKPLKYDGTIPPLLLDECKKHLY